MGCVLCLLDLHGCKLNTVNSRPSKPVGQFITRQPQSRRKEKWTPVSNTGVNLSPLIFHSQEKNTSQTQTISVTLEDGIPKGLSTTKSKKSSVATTKLQKLTIGQSHCAHSESCERMVHTLGLLITDPTYATSLSMQIKTFVSSIVDVRMMAEHTIPSCCLFHTNPKALHWTPYQCVNTSPVRWLMSQSTRLPTKHSFIEFSMLFKFEWYDSMAVLISILASMRYPSGTHTPHLCLCSPIVIHVPHECS